MKNEQEIADRLTELRKRLRKVTKLGKDHAKKTGANRSTLGIKSRRLIEGEIVGLTWVLGVPDPGRTPTIK